MSPLFLGCFGRADLDFLEAVLWRASFSEASMQAYFPLYHKNNLSLRSSIGMINALLNFPIGKTHRSYNLVASALSLPLVRPTIRRRRLFSVDFRPLLLALASYKSFGLGCCRQSSPSSKWHRFEHDVPIRTSLCSLVNQGC